MNIAERARGIFPSQIRRITDRARPTSIHLGLGQPDTAIHPDVQRALADYLKIGRAPYTPNLGTNAAREAVAKHLKIDASEVMITLGVQEGLAVTLLGTVNPGEEVLVPDPGFPAYANLVRAAGAIPVGYSLESGNWGLSAAAIESVITPKTRAIVLNSPSNPTGAVHAAADLLQVLELCSAKGIHWISDEIYEDFVYVGSHVSPAESHPDQGLRIGGLSKSHSMMGWRIGWVTGHPDVIESLKGLHQHLVTSACGAAQAALPVALDVHSSHVDSMRRIFHARGLSLQDGLRQGGLECPDPVGAFYHFVHVPEASRILGGTIPLAEAILDHADVVTIPGFGFGTGGEGYLRLAYTVSDDLLFEAASKVASFVAEVVQRG